MNSISKICLKFLLFVAVLFATASLSQANEAATATFTATSVSPGVTQYDLTLTDTGTTNIGTFWFSWIPGAGFMSVAPTSVVSPSGWSDMLTNGNGAIQYVTTTPITPGTSVTGFKFDSTLTPAQLEGPSSMPGIPVDTFFTYIGAPLADPGFQGVATPAHSANAPEPATLTLASIAFGLIGCGRRFRKETRA